MGAHSICVAKIITRLSPWAGHTLSMTAGYWEPHTSSIDFCEENYRFTTYVAELLNSLTSLPIAVAGAWAWAYATPKRYRSWPRFGLAWLAFMAIGIGSALFHATLRRSAQALDEVPMVFANLVFIYCLLLPSETQASQLAIAFTIVACILTSIYVVWEAYVVFFFMYGLGVLYLFISAGLRAYRSQTQNAVVLQYMWKLGGGTYALGFGIWIADNVACKQLGVGYLHMAWHFFACAGTVVFVLWLIASTADAEEHEVKLRWRCLLPCLVLLADEKHE